MTYDDVSDDCTIMIAIYKKKKISTGKKNGCSFIQIAQADKRNENFDI